MYLYIEIRPDRRVDIDTIDPCSSEDAAVTGRPVYVRTVDQP
jgi:hypothetical protein